MQFYELLPQNHVHGSNIRCMSPEGVVHCCKSNVSKGKEIMVNNKLTVYGIPRRYTSCVWNRGSGHNLEGRQCFA